MKITVMTVCFFVLGPLLLADSTSVKPIKTDTAPVAKKVEQLREQQTAMTGQLQSIKRLLLQRASIRSRVRADSVTAADTTLTTSTDSTGREATDGGME